MQQLRLASPGLLRLCLATLVVVHHLSSVALGAWAVNVFFMMSGYWVMVMYRDKYTRYRTPVMAFYTSRYLRLAPVFLVSQCLMLAAMLWGQAVPYPVPGPSVAWLIRCAAMVGSASQQVYLIPAWSIDVEAQFYLVLPLIAIALSGLATERRWVWAAAGAAAFMPLAFANTTNPPFLPMFLAFFLIGMANALAPWVPSRRVWMSSFTGFSGLIALAPVTQTGRGLLLGGHHPFDPALFRYNFQFCAVLTLLFIPFLFHSLSIRSTPLDRHLGNLAYPVYLFHWIPQFLLGAAMIRYPIGARIFDVLLVAAGSVLIYRWIDQPAERFRVAFMKRHFARIEQNQSTREATGQDAGNTGLEFAFHPARRSGSGEAWE